MTAASSEGGEEERSGSPASPPPSTPTPEKTPITPTPESEEVCRTPESSESEHEKSPKGALKKSSEWFPEVDGVRKKRDVAFAPLSPHILNHHLTIGPHGGIDWVRRLGLETQAARKAVNGSQLEIGSLPDARCAGSTETPEEAAIRHSTDCIVAAKDLAALSDSDLLRSAPPWAQRSKFRFSPDKDGKAAAESSRKVSTSSAVVAASSSSTPEVRRPSAPAGSVEKSREDSRPRSDSATTGVSSSGTRPRITLQPAPPYPSTSGAPTTPTSTPAPASALEDFAAKKSRVKASLLKRARSVAIFSLKLKERRARDALAKEAKAASPPSSKPPPLPSQQWTGRNPDRVEGELSCIPIEKLISVDDVAVELMRKRTNT